MVSGSAPRDDGTASKLNKSMTSAATIMTALVKFKSLIKKGSTDNQLSPTNLKQRTNELGEGPVRD